MRLKTDQRLWLDRVQGREEFGLFPDSRFYSVEFVSDDKERISAFLEKVATYRRWARDSYLEQRAGREALPFPEELLDPRPVAKARPPKASREEGGAVSSQE